MSTVMIDLSAPTPRVSSWESSWASSALATECVAPRSSAISRLLASGSTAMMFAAPAWLAPWTALVPMPPMP